jgi:predicted MPP superfamily phosphohydrolase
MSNIINEGKDFTVKKDKLKTKKKIYKLVILLVILLTPIFILLCMTDNKTLEFIEYDINHNENDETITVMQLSDMHFPKCKVNTNLIIDKIEEENVDIVAITGDFIDGSAKVENCGVIPFIEKLSKFPNVYFVSGNHELANSEYDKLRESLISNNIKILDNTFSEITIKNKKISIMGLIDNYDYYTKYFKGLNPSSYKILLAHRPEKFNVYVSSIHEFNPDLILSGHAHGGQVRFHDWSLIAPDQGFNPEYTSGIYSCHNMHMIVSRGIGNSILPWRINNKPEVPIIRIKQ